MNRAKIVIDKLHERLPPVVVASGHDSYLSIGHPAWGKSYLWVFWPDGEFETATNKAGIRDSHSWTWDDFDRDMDNAMLYGRYDPEEGIVTMTPGPVHVGRVTEKDVPSFLLRKLKMEYKDIEKVVFFK